MLMNTAGKTTSNTNAGLELRARVYIHRKLKMLNPLWISYQKVSSQIVIALHPSQIKNAKSLVEYQKVSSQILIAFCAQWKKLFKATQT